MSTKFTPTAQQVQNVTNHYLMQLILRKALQQFGDMNNIPKVEQTTMVFNKAMNTATKA